MKKKNCVQILSYDNPNEVAEYEYNDVLNKAREHINYIRSKTRTMLDEAQIAVDSLLDRKPHVAAQFQKNMISLLGLELDLVKMELALGDSKSEQPKINDNRTIVFNLDEKSRKVLADVISGRFNKY